MGGGPGGGPLAAPGVGRAGDRAGAARWPRRSGSCARRPRPIWTGLRDGARAPVGARARAGPPGRRPGGRARPASPPGRCACWRRSAWWRWGSDGVRAAARPRRRRDLDASRPCTAPAGTRAHRGPRPPRPGPDARPPRPRRARRGGPRRLSAVRAVRRHGSDGARERTSADPWRVQGPEQRPLAPAPVVQFGRSPPAFNSPAGPPSAGVRTRASGRAPRGRRPQTAVQFTHVEGPRRPGSGPRAGRPGARRPHRRGRRAPPGRRPRRDPPRLRVRRGAATAASCATAGEPFITHPLGCARICAGLGLDGTGGRRRAAARHRRGHRRHARGDRGGVRHRGRAARRRGHQALQDPLREPGGPPGRELPQADRLDVERHPRAGGQARRPPPQHAHARLHDQAEADPEGQGDARGLRAARAPPRHPLAQVGARGPRLRDAAPQAVQRDPADGQPAPARPRGVHRGGRPDPRTSSSPPWASPASRSPGGPSTSIRSTTR